LWGRRAEGGEQGGRGRREVAAEVAGAQGLRPEAFFICGALWAFVSKGISTGGELGLPPPPPAGEGWGGGDRAHESCAGRIDVVACPLPIPPPQAGEGMHRVRGANVLHVQTIML